MNFSLFVQDDDDGLVCWVQLRRTLGRPSDVDALVLLQVPHVGETLTALVAHERLLSGVNLLVGFQAVPLAEAAAADVAAEGLLAGVDALVSVQVARVAEVLPADVAAERLLSGVDHLCGEGKGHWFWT